ncbi:MAG: cell wall-binding repeat-containing protein, partial [Coriobacteriia bacterium]|nr:cell wall-binding repeat-containing protein [Coriobacteriia bacterium]
TAPIAVSALGPHTLEYWSVDVAGNEETHTTKSFDVVAGTVTYISVAGETRFETAVEASTLAFPRGASCVVIATARNWPDALGGAALAGAKNAPILLVDTNAVPAAVAAEIVRLGASEAVILGGETALSADVFEALEDMVGAGDVTRIGGATRYETARMIADKVVTITGATTGFVSTARNFPDALAVAPVAVAKGWPIYLAEADTPATMQADGITDGIILGGTSVVSTDAEDALRLVFGRSHVTRLSGNNRYQTAIAIAAYGCDECGLDWDGVALTSGTGFADALAGGVLQGECGSVMLLTPSTSLDADVAKKLADEVDVIREVHYLGGINAISQAVRDAVSVILK